MLRYQIQERLLRAFEMQIQVLDFREIFIITQLYMRRDSTLQLRIGTRILTNL